MVDESTLEVVRGAMRASPPRVPGPRDHVHKDECAFSFDTPLSPGGVYISLVSWQAYGSDFVALDHERTGCQLYLHEQWTRVRLFVFCTLAGALTQLCLTRLPGQHCCCTAREQLVTARVCCHAKHLRASKASARHVPASCCARRCRCQRRSAPRRRRARRSWRWGAPAASRCAFS